VELNLPRINRNIGTVRQVRCHYTTMLLHCNVITLQCYYTAIFQIAILILQHHYSYLTNYLQLILVLLKYKMWITLVIKALSKSQGHFLLANQRT
jgi:hypothetical protein